MTEAEALAALESHLLLHGIHFGGDDEDRTLAAMRYYHMEDHTHSSPMGEMPLDHQHVEPL